MYIHNVSSVEPHEKDNDLHCQIQISMWTIFSCSILRPSPSPEKYPDFQYRNGGGTREGISELRAQTVGGKVALHIDQARTAQCGHVHIRLHVRCHVVLYAQRGGRRRRVLGVFG